MSEPERVPPLVLDERCRRPGCWAHLPMLPRPMLVLEWIVAYDAAHLSLTPAPPMPTIAGLIRCRRCGHSFMVHGAARLAELAEAVA